MVRLPHFIRYPKQYRPFLWLARSKQREPSPPAPVFHRRTLAKPPSTAIDEACRRLGLERTGSEPVRRRFSVGAVVAGPEGERYWLKVSGYRDRVPDGVRKKLLWLPAIPGVPVPSILGTAEWTLDGTHWLAVKMTLAPSPAVEPAVYARENAGRVSDQWIAALKGALDCLAASGIPAERRITPQMLETTIRARWGKDAPCAADDWRPAHGDLQWSNVTAPNLMLLDWSGFGLVPRGFDAARLIFSSFYQPDLVRRLEEAFADDLQSDSGRVAALFAAARWLDTVAAIRGTRKYQAWIREKAEGIISDG